MRKLTIRKETLTELSAAELSAIAGGTVDLTNACVSDSCTGVMCLFTDVICFEQ